MKVIVASNLSKNLPIGSLLFWGGLASEIPTGWELFNSAADAFIMGTNTAGINLTKQGADTHVHTTSDTANGGIHKHDNKTITTNQNTGSQAAPGGSTASVGFHTHSATLSTDNNGEHYHDISSTDSKDHKPPYIRYYLMKSIDVVDIPTGAIAIWAGRLIDIPSGWHNCDGSTVGGITLPDIRGRFIYVPSSDTDKGKTGGANSHSHSKPTYTYAITNAHFHHGTCTTSTYSGSSVNVVSGGGTVERSNASHSHPNKTFSTKQDYNEHQHTLPSIKSAVEILPPYIKAYYIMKVQS